MKSWEGFFCENIVLKILKDSELRPELSGALFVFFILSEVEESKKTKKRERNEEFGAQEKKYVLAFINERIFLSSFFNF